MKTSSNSLFALQAILGVEHINVEFDANEIIGVWLKNNEIENVNTETNHEKNQVTLRQIGYFFGVSKKFVSKHFPALTRHESGGYVIDYSNPWWVEKNIVDGDITSFWHNNKHAHTKTPTYGHVKDRGRRFWRPETYQKAFGKTDAEMSKLQEIPGARVRITHGKNDPVILDSSVFNSRLSILEVV